MEKIFCYLTTAEMPSSKLDGTTVVYTKDTSTVHWNKQGGAISATGTNCTVQAFRKGGEVATPWTGCIGENVILKVIPTEGNFIKWEDGNTDNPRIVAATSSAQTFKGICGKVSTACLKFEGSGTMTIKAEKATGSFEGSADGIFWNTINLTSGVVADNVYYIRGKNFTTLEKLNGFEKVSGNIHSLINYEEVENKQVPTTQPIAIQNLFAYNTTIKDASGLILPYDTLLPMGYCYMFAFCTALTHAPSLPATHLASNCYYSFLQETAITKCPELPADIVPSFAYAHFLQRCTSITEPVILPATNINAQAYQYMFSDSSVTEVYCSALMGGVNNWMYHSSTTGVLHYSAASAITYWDLPSTWTKVADL